MCAKSTNALQDTCMELVATLNWPVFVVIYFSICLDTDGV